MSGLDESGLFRPGRPVVLPQETDRGHTRGVLTAVALMVLVLGIASGIVYQQMYAVAGDDVSRLLGASTRAYARVSRPWRVLRHALSLDRWAERDRLAEIAEHTGLLADGSPAVVAGLPATLFRRVLVSVDDLHLAVVPTLDGPSVMAFVALGDPWARRRVSGALGPNLETVDRQLGFDIQSVQRSVSLLPWEEDASPIRLVSMDPYLVVAVGPVVAVEDLLGARVSGHSRPLAARDGFERDAATRTPADDMWVFLDPGAVFDAVVEAGAELGEEGARLRAAVTEGTRALSLAANITEIDDVLTLRAELTPSSDAAEMSGALAGGRHPLVDRAPIDADVVVSLSVADLRAAATAFADRRPLGELLGAARSALADHLRSSSLVGDLVGELLASEDGSAFGGEIVFVALAAPEGSLPEPDEEGPRPEPARWILLVRVEDPARAEAALERALERALSDAWAVGAIRDGDGRLHLVRPIRPAGRGADLGELLAWRIRDGVLELAPSLEALATTSAAGGVPVYGDTLVGRRAMRSLPPESALLVLLHPKTLGAVAGTVGRWLARVLSPQFRLAAVASIRSSELTIHVNASPLTVAAALAATSVSDLDRMLLGGLWQACADALAAMCRLYPRAEPCTPLRPARLQQAREACRRLGQ